MTNPQAHAIAEAAVKVHDATADLKVSTEKGNRQDARDGRRAVAEAQTALTQAIRSAVER